MTEASVARFTLLGWAKKLVYLVGCGLGPVRGVGEPRQLRGREAQACLAGHPHRQAAGERSALGLGEQLLEVIQQQRPAVPGGVGAAPAR